MEIAYTPGMGVYERIRRLGGRLFLVTGAVASLSALFFLQSFPVQAAGTPRMEVRFLYSLEDVSGKGDRLRNPMDMAWDSKARELYVADAGRSSLVIFDRNGGLVDELKVDPDLGSPTKVATDAEGRIYIGYNRSKKITVLDFRGEPLGSYELPGVLDMPKANIRPMFLATGPDGHVYALKSSGGVVEIDPYGEHHRVIPVEGENAPASIFGFAVDDRGRFLFSNMRPAAVVRFDPATKRFEWFGEPGSVYGQLSRPQGVVGDAKGRIFVTSLLRSKVLCYDRNGRFLEEFGGLGKGYGRFYMPEKILSGGEDRLFVLEPTLHRVQVFQVTFPGDSPESISQDQRVAGEAAVSSAGTPGI